MGCKVRRLGGIFPVDVKGELLPEMLFFSYGQFMHYFNW